MLPPGQNDKYTNKLIGKLVLVLTKSLMTHTHSVMINFHNFSLLGSLLVGEEQL